MIENVKYSKIEGSNSNGKTVHWILQLLGTRYTHKMHRTAIIK